MAIIRRSTPFGCPVRMGHRLAAKRSWRACERVRRRADLHCGGADGPLECDVKVNINIPPVTQALILINVVVYFLMMLLGEGPFLHFALWPLGMEGFNVGFMPWQLVSYSFLHGGMLHLFFNMYALFLFGGEIERLFGSRWYASYYFVCVITAAIAQLIVEAMTGSTAPTIGASGGVFGLLLAFGMYFPQRKLMLIFLPVPLPAWLFVTLYGGLELYLGVTQTASGIAHFAHLGGMVGGYLMILQRRGRWPRGRR
jgi:membrane associated rhomboid family serine protease